MSKSRDGESQVTSLEDNSKAMDQPIEVKRGTKRKLKAKGAEERGNHGVLVKKGAGKLIKFGEEQQKVAKNDPVATQARLSASIGSRSPTLAVTQSSGISTTSIENQATSQAARGSASSKPPKRPKRPESSTPILEGSRLSISSKNKSRQHERGFRPSEDFPAPVHGRDHVPSYLVKKRDELLLTRKTLPIWPHAQSIRDALRKNNILVLTGETGSGKSTQLPQFLTSEPWCTKTIAITQPRRVAAISLARRVAEEMGSLMGTQSPAAKVGYSVRFDNASGPNTKVKFLTEGMLLQEVLRDPEMAQYSAVVVDEVHERSVNVDLILGFLRTLVSEVERGEGKRKHPLKVVVMSATADVEALVQFFDKGFSSSSASALVRTPPKLSGMISTCFVEGRQFPVKTTYLPEPSPDWAEAALKIIFQIHYKEPLPGDVLVFLTGQDKIEGLEKLINDYAEGMDKEMPKLLALPLFAALPQQAQQRIFHATPRHTRKIILATNIAETSVTVPGVRFVVDCGKSKIKQFRAKLGLESLLAKPISKSAATQRKGRAGREAPGQCYRLYTEADYKIMEERTSPEILRCDLSQALLTMKARGIDDVLNFAFLDRPPREALLKALEMLLRLGAIKADGSISDIGLKLARLPVAPMLGRILLEAARPERDCLLDVIDIVAALSTEDNIFFNIVSEERKEAAEEARRELYRREGDHMTYLTTVQQYAEEQSDRKAWCERHFISHRAMQNVMNIRKQLRQQCQNLKLLSPSEASATVTSPQTDAILACLLRGFVQNTARLMPDGSYQTFITHQTVAVHPSSVLHGRKIKAEAIVFSEFLFTAKAYAKKISAVQMNWVEEVMEEAIVGQLGSA